MSDVAPSALVAEFTTEDAIVAAAHSLNGAGFRRIEAYTPLPIAGLDVLTERQIALPVIIFLAGLFGCVGSLLLQWWAAAIDYPINIGGRPLAAWVAFGPTTFELTVLAGVAGGFIAWFAVC